METWSVSDVAAWLNTIGFGYKCQAFITEDINGEVLLEIDHNILDELAIDQAQHDAFLLQRDLDASVSQQELHERPDFDPATQPETSDRPLAETSAAEAEPSASVEQAVMDPPLTAAPPQTKPALEVAHTSAKPTRPPKPERPVKPPPPATATTSMEPTPEQSMAVLQATPEQSRPLTALEGITCRPSKGLPDLSDEERLLILQQVTLGEISPEEASVLIAKTQQSKALQGETHSTKPAPKRLNSLKSRLGRLAEKTKRLYVDKVTGLELPEDELELAVLHDQTKMFGFVIGDTAAPPRIVSITFADICPMLVLGDVVVQINGVDCHYMSGSKANELLLQTPVGWKADLVIRRPPKRAPTLTMTKGSRPARPARPNKPARSEAVAVSHTVAVAARKTEANPLEAHVAAASDPAPTAPVAPPRRKTKPKLVVEQ